MKDLTRTTRLAALAALALLAIPLAVAQSGPPPGYTDPLAYAQDYAKEQADQAGADPAAYAANHTTPEALAQEAEHTAWLACWTAHSQGLPLDAACSRFFVPPGVVDAPAEAQAEVTETLNGTEALTGEVLDAVNDTVADPMTAVEQVKRIVAAVQAFLGSLVDGLKEIVGGLVDVVKDLVGLVLGIADLAASASLAGLGALADGLLALIGLPALGIQAALEGIGAALGGAADGLAAAATGFVSAIAAVVDGLAAAALAVAGAAGSGLDGLTSGLAALGQAVADAGSATVDAVGDAADAVVDTVADAAEAVTDTVGGWFGADAASDGSDRGLVDGDDLETGTGADGLVDRILDLV